MNHDDTYKEIFDVARDTRDPAGIDPHARGTSLRHDLTRGAGKPFIWYEAGGTPMPMTWDVFKLDGEPGWIQALCPRCMIQGTAPDEAGLTIHEDSKPFEYDARAEVPPFTSHWTRQEMARLQRAGLPPGPGGRLTIEKVIVCPRCTWQGQVVNNVLKDTR